MIVKNISFMQIKCFKMKIIYFMDKKKQFFILKIKYFKKKQKTF